MWPFLSLIKLVTTSSQSPVAALHTSQVLFTASSSEYQPPQTRPGATIVCSPRGFVIPGSEQLVLFSGIQASTELVYPPVMKRAETRVNNINWIYIIRKKCGYFLIDDKIPFADATKGTCTIPNMKNNAKWILMILIVKQMNQKCLWSLVSSDMEQSGI